MDPDRCSRRSSPRRSSSSSSASRSAAGSTGRRLPYEVFIVPGLIAMAMAQAAYSNNSSTIFQARSDRYIDDVLAAPMHAWQMNLGLSVGGVFRALADRSGADGDRAAADRRAGERAARAAGVAVLLLVALFGALGIIVGIYAETFDHHTFINNIVILPLTFLGGVFYSVERAAQPVGADLPRQPALLRRQHGPLRLPRDQRRRRLARVRRHRGDDSGCSPGRSTCSQAGAS